MADKVQKVTVKPLADVTGLITGTSFQWSWEAETVYVNGVDTAFTQDASGLIDIPGYTTGIVLVEFNLYLIHGAVSGVYPKDPTDSLSTPVFWENRVTGFIGYSTTIKSFETGLTEISIGSIGVHIDDDWLPLIQNILIVPNRTVRIYLDDVIKFKGITTRSAVNNFVLTFTIQKRQTILDSETNWGDPEYLNRVVRTSANAYYTGSAIPEQFENVAIPMLFGETTPYELGKVEEIDLGTPGGFFLVPPSTKGRSRSPNTDRVICKVIPTSATTGIIGRMPAYQTLPASSPINEALTGAAHIFGRFEQSSNAVTFTDMIMGEVCVLERSGGAPIIVAARLYDRKTSAPARSWFFLGYDDPPGGGNFTNIQNADRYRHFFTTEIPRETWTTPAVLSSTLTPGGHRWLTVSGLTGIDLLTTDLYVVLNNISGAKSGPELMQWALETHGYTVEPTSFAAMDAIYPDKACMQAGFGSSVPTLGNFIAEINRTLLTILVFPASNDEPYLVRVDPTAPATITLDDDQIANFSYSSDYRSQTKNVIFEPAYFRSDDAKADLTFNIPSPRAEIWGSEKTETVDHVLSEVTTTRFEDIADFYGNPVTPCKFDLFDDTVELELADIVQIDTVSFKQKIVVTTIEQLPIGRAIQGRYLYVNED